ncbi:glutamate-5-semialdehyde dehydrogenase [Leptothermofonsia sichuanensis E412]|uniref:glutamate-5-semialdehyde dehydrogenase n=1 Tax=Leptothermofonsia sichuanensis TaxID=2917832 RepID=UPI001CA63270|nr:glutamate-5-semialdehyde dehydrogenase [Leptothermofonsia sichuanensis]QZZ19743.1 glutamate-5-semialdehyde dehydrogenase [Leptothermofonsia sichuanensis E412]
MTPDTFSPSSDSVAAVQRAYRASIEMATTKGTLRSRAVQEMAKALRRQQDEILEANTLDLEASREMAVPDLLLEWLKLTRERIQSTVQLLERLSELPDPIGRVMNAMHQVDQCQAHSQLMPLGVIALIYEAFPELGVIAAGLCIKTGNSLILKGGTEASNSNLVIAQAIHSALDDAGLPTDCFHLLSSDQGASVRDLIVQDQYLNLVIPYGRPSLVQQILRQATVPVLKTTMGNCYLYWAPSGSLEAVRWIILDSHQSEPDPVNAIEKVLIHRNQNPSSLGMLWNSLREKGFQLKGDTELVAEFPELKLAEESEWRQAYLSKTVAFKVVDSLEAAISFINLHSNGHADCLVTESYQESRRFALGINSASAYINASPRFSRNPQRGNSIFLGMSSQKGHRRGLISLETLTTVKHIIQGTGQF